MKNFFTRLNRLFKTEQVIGRYENAPVVLSQELIIDMHMNAGDYYYREAIVFFENTQTYGAFKYDAVKEILFSDDFGVSPMHTFLNRIYFQTDKERHAHNKKTAIKHLEFLSKKLQFENAAYIKKVFDELIKYLPEKTAFDLVDQLINPIIIINAFNDFGFLKVFPEFDPFLEGFSYETMVKKASEVFNTRSVLERMLEEAMHEQNIPVLIKTLLNELSVEGGFEAKELPLFYTTVIYTAIENTASFVGSMVYHVLKKYPQLLDDDNDEELTFLGDELLRIYSPNFVTFRTVLNDVNYNGTHLKKGALVGLFIGAANMDPNVFNDPKEIKFNREEKHLAFGRGRISCIGQFAAFALAKNMLASLAHISHDLVIIDNEPVYLTQGVVKLSGINVIYRA